jgi:hypothetical protein
MTSNNRKLIVRTLSGDYPNDVLVTEIHEIATDLYTVSVSGEYSHTLEDYYELLEFTEELFSSQNFLTLLSLKYELSKILFESDISIDTTVVSTLFGPTIFISSIFSEDDILSIVDALNAKLYEDEDDDYDEDFDKLYSSAIN